MTPHDRITAIREAFEAWFLSGTTANLERSGDSYHLMSAYSAWNAWQAAHEHLTTLLSHPDTLERVAKALEANEWNCELSDYECFKSDAQAALTELQKITGGE